jgi:hypothetical protein
MKSIQDLAHMHPWLLAPMQQPSTMVATMVAIEGLTFIIVYRSRLCTRGSSFNLSSIPPGQAGLPAKLDEGISLLAFAIVR